jgi:hypothetical protein
VFELIDDHLLWLLLDSILSASLVYSSIEPPPPSPGISSASFRHNIPSTTHQSNSNGGLMGCTCCNRCLGLRRRRRGCWR